jgi:glycosyltransferase involved in cell wall biosynthesis
MHIAIITAGGAGMYCGSCMRDNTLARALMAAGHEVSLLPTYTPIRVDEADASVNRVFLGGVNLYLEANMPGWRWLPRFLTRWLDAPDRIRSATKKAVSVNAAELGRMTHLTLQGEDGPHRNQVRELAEFISRELKPDVVCFTNALLAGVLPSLRREFSGRIVCFLQGDDVFLKDLVVPWKERVVDLLRERVRLFDGYIANCEFYRRVMCDWLNESPDRVRIVPLGLDLDGHTGVPRPTPHSPFTVGYFARVCPEKGFHHAVEAFRELHRREPTARFVAGGYLGPRDQAFFDRVMSEAADLGDAVRYAGSPANLAEKVALLQQFDVLCAPGEYAEPKGLFVLEAWANGVPVVLPDQGSFPDLVAETSGGVLVPPGDLAATADALQRLMNNPAERYSLAENGYNEVRSRLTAARMADRTVAAINDIPAQIPAQHVSLSPSASAGATRS